MVESFSDREKDFALTKVVLWQFSLQKSFLTWYLVSRHDFLDQIRLATPPANSLRYAAACFWQGWLQAAGCAGLTLGPVVGGALYHVSHNSHYKVCLSSCRGCWRHVSVSGWPWVLWWEVSWILWVSTASGAAVFHCLFTFLLMLLIVKF